MKNIFLCLILVLFSGFKASSQNSKLLNYDDFSPPREIEIDNYKMSIWEIESINTEEIRVVEQWVIDITHEPELSHSVRFLLYNDDGSVLWDSGFIHGSTIVKYSKNNRYSLVIKNSFNWYPGDDSKTTVSHIIDFEKQEVIAFRHSRAAYEVGFEGDIFWIDYIQDFGPRNKIREYFDLDGNLIIKNN